MEKEQLPLIQRDVAALEIISLTVFLDKEEMIEMLTDNEELRDLFVNFWRQNNGIQ